MFVSQNDLLTAKILAYCMSFYNTVACGFCVAQETTALVLDPVVTAPRSLAEANLRIGFDEATVVDTSIGAATLRS